MAGIIFKVINERTEMTIKSKVDEILNDDSNDFNNRKFGLISKLARDLEDEVAKLKMENEELQKRLSLANIQINSNLDAQYHYNSYQWFPTFGR